VIRPVNTFRVRPLRGGAKNVRMLPFGPRLRDLRLKAGLTQEQLAHACGWSGQSRTANYENGTRDPAFEELPLIAAALGVTIAELFTDTEKDSHTGSDLWPRSVRPDPATLSTAYKVALAAAKLHLGENGLNLAKKRDAEIVADAYRLVADGGLTSRGISSALEAVIRQHAKTGGHSGAATPAGKKRTTRKR